MYLDFITLCTHQLISFSVRREETKMCKGAVFLIFIFGKAVNEYLDEGSASFTKQNKFENLAVDRVI